MSELRASDIQHAVQSALHGIQNDVSRISHIIDSLNRAGSDVQDLSRRLSNVERSLNQVQNTLANTASRNTSQPYSSPQINAMANDINELKARFATIEKFAIQMGDYMRDRYDQDKEDKQYRTA